MNSAMTFQGFYQQPSRAFACDETNAPDNIAELMQTKLQKTFFGEFDHVEVVNADGFGQKVDIFVISEQFKGKLPIARHRMINEILKEEIAMVHAVVIEAKTVDQLSKEKR